MAQIAALKADPEWVKRHCAGDHETADQMRQLHERAYAPTPGVTQYSGPTIEQQRSQMANHYADLGPGLPAGVVEEIRRGSVNSPAIYAEAASTKAALIRDPAFVKRYMDNETAARKQMLLLDVMLSGRVSLENK
jgi:hypothetical protein